MPEDNNSINMDEAIPSGMDYDFLLKEAISALMPEVTDTWTDFNEHDPGITILQQLVYALTDLSYRTHFPIKDLLTDKNGNIPYQSSALFSAPKVLTTSPITRADYERTLLDHFNKELESVELTPLEGTPLSSISGRYAVTLLLKKGRNESKVRKRVKRFLDKNRNLCETFASITCISPSYFDLVLKLSIKPSFNPVNVEASIIKAVKKVTESPSRLNHFYELNEAQGYDTIFDGPLHKYGAPKSQESAGIGSCSSRLSQQLYKALQSLHSIQSIENIDIQLHHQAMDPELPLRIQRLRIHYPYGKETSCILNEPDTHDAEAEGSVFDGETESVHIGDFFYGQDSSSLLPQGTYRALEEYSSIQNQFPAIYGLMKNGIPQGDTPLRKAQAKQLKAYLLIFEQIMANYLAQLANINRLFSTKTQQHTYFYQPLYSVPDVAPLLKGADPQDDLESQAWEEFIKYGTGANGYIMGLDKLIHNQDDFYDRRDRFINHLLARFSETLSTVWTNPEVIIDDKTELLRNYPVLGHSRTQGMRLRVNPLITEREENESTIQKRIKIIFEIYPYNIRSLVNSFEIKTPRGTIPIAEATSSYSEFLDVIHEIQKDGAQLWLRIERWNQYYIIVMNEKIPKDRYFFYTKLFETKVEAQACIATLDCKIKFSSLEKERDYYLLEHVAFIPDEGAPIVITEEKTFKVKTAFFSERLTHILYRWPKNYYSPSGNYDFEPYVEQMIEDLVPAHLLGKFSWIWESNSIETLYQNWVDNECPPLTITGIDEDKQVITVLENTPAGALVNWLLELPYYRRFRVDA